MKDVDLVIHLIAIVGEPACHKDEIIAIKVNYQGTVNIDKCRSSSPVMIFVSTGTNYGKIEGVCREESPLNPLTT